MVDFTAENIHRSNFYDFTKSRFEKTEGEMENLN